MGLGLAGLLVVVSAEAAAASDQPRSLDAAQLPAGRIPPREWARSVCTSATEWRSSIDDLVDSIETEVGQAESLADARGILVTFLGNAVQATDTLLDRLRQAGVPRIRDGKKIADVFEDGFVDIRELFADGQKSARKLSVSSARRFRAAASELGDDITKGGEEIEQAIDEAGREYKAANRALDDPACRDLR